MHAPEEWGSFRDKGGSVMRKRVLQRGNRTLIVGRAAVTKGRVSAKTKSAQMWGHHFSTEIQGVPWAFAWLALFPHFRFFFFFKQLKKKIQLTQRYLKGKIISEDLDTLHLRLHHHIKRAHRESEMLRKGGLYPSWAFLGGHSHYLWTSVWHSVFSSGFIASSGCAFSPFFSFPSIVGFKTLS